MTNACKLQCPNCGQIRHPEDRNCKKCGAPVCVNCSEG